MRMGVVGSGARICRQTVYRVLRRMGVAVARRKKQRDRDTRRFAYPHRLEMVLCDGKHFRAGAGRLRRVALFYLDDATRLGLNVVVGTSETRALFLRGLYETVRRHGRMLALYVDHGPGFIANDSAAVCARLEVALVLGESSYPEAHGKIERFNQTAKRSLLRNLDRRPDIDPDCRALELRLRHWLFEIYNHTPHESLPKPTEEVTS
jgi:transposase InsO family protein